MVSTLRKQYKETKLELVELKTVRGGRYIKLSSRTVIKSSLFKLYIIGQDLGKLEKGLLVELEEIFVYSKKAQFNLIWFSSKDTKLASSESSYPLFTK